MRSDSVRPSICLHACLLACLVCQSGTLWDGKWENPMQELQQKDEAMRERAREGEERRKGGRKRPW